MGEPETDLPRRLGLVVERGDFSVPPYPAAAMRLRTLLESNKYGLSQVADAAGADPALAAALLRVANSSLYRGDGPPLTTLLRAVNRLGARAVSSLALAAGIGSEACAPGPLADVKYRVWRRSITCALGAQRFAATRGVEAEAAFLAGLLHGFGRSVALACVEKLILGSSRAHTAEEWLALVETHRAPLADRVARAWQLPETIVEAMSSNAPSEQAMPAL
ncbi:MAG TPA: HDOD domain-containing protein, partial [Polyangiaceae bacterium]|nr:HDOD domain-containing protein [Polyangiaceae bacterium]